jgi:Mor family transcriptional regulator
MKMYRVYCTTGHEIIAYKEENEYIGYRQGKCLNANGFYLPSGIPHDVEYPYYHIDIEFEGSNYEFVIKLQNRLKAILRNEIINKILYEDL